MKQIIADLSWKNWNKKPGNLLTTIFGIFSVLMSVQGELLELLHESPIPISTTVDAWIIWLNKVGVWALTLLMLLSRKKDIDVGVKVTESRVDESRVAPAEDEHLNP